jgi:hypothetical protein
LSILLFGPGGAMAAGIVTLLALFRLHATEALSIAL